MDDPPPPIPQEVIDLVENAIAEHDVVVFSKSWCPYSRKVKTFLRTEHPDVTPYVIEVDEREDGDRIVHYLLEKTGRKTVPNIWIHQKHIGGSDEYVILRSKKLLPSLLKPNPVPEPTPTQTTTAP